MRYPGLLIIQLLICLEATTQELPSGDPAIILSDSKLEKIFDKASFTESPATSPDGFVFFVDRDLGGKIWRINPVTGESFIYRSPTGAALGIEFDSKGQMVVATAGFFGCRCISRTDITSGNSIILAGLYEGKPFNGPNDLTIDESGRIYFTDYGFVAPYEVLHHRINGVYRISGDTLIERIIDHPGRPNGIVISPDQKTLYVSYADADVYKRGVITAYDILPGGEVRLRSIFAQFDHGEYGADGLTVDNSGNLYAALPTRDMSSLKYGVAVYAPSGNRIAFIPVKGGATNVTFGRNKQSHELFITRGPNVYRIKVGSEGYHIPQETK